MKRKGWWNLQSNRDYCEKCSRLMGECTCFLPGAHTPGEWFAGGQLGAGIWIRTESAQIAVVYGSHVTPESAANARLIIAAPDLLKAARSIIAWAKKHDRGHEGSELLEILCDTNNAVAKAEGKLARKEPS